MAGGAPFDMRALMEAMGGGGGGMPGMGMPGMGGMPGMPDMGALQEMMQNPDMQRQMMESMQNDPTIKAFQQIAEEFAKDPEFVEMTQALQSQMGGSAGAGGTPDMAQYQEAMKSVFTNEKYMRKAEQLGKAILSSNPDMSNAMQSFMQQSYNPEVASQMEETMKGIKEDPKFKGFIDLMEAGKVADGMAYLQERPELMKQYNEALSKAFETIMPAVAEGAQGGTARGLAAQEEEEEEELVDLHTAASEGEPTLVKELLAAGASVDDQDDEGRTALHFACGYGELECAQLLLAAGATVDAVDNNKNTALHYAAGYGQVDGVKLLLKHKASLVAPNQDGNTAVEVARLNEHEEVVALLEKAQPPKGLGAGLAPSKKK